MGLSTFDIPTHLIYPGKKPAFLDWLASIPADSSAKRRIMSTWSHATREPLTPQDWSRGLAKPQPPKSDAS
jgi:hypothetical protein